MDKPADGFWKTTSSSDKGWKTRRAQQDAYRRALDQQIEERKALDSKRAEKVKSKETFRPSASSTTVTDPVQHLMPWLGPNKGNTEDNEGKATSNPAPTPNTNDSGPEPGQSLPPTPATPPQIVAAVPPAGLYGSNSNAGHAYNNQGPIPTVAGALSGNLDSSNRLPAGVNVSPSVQHHPHRNVAYGYYDYNTPVVVPPPPAGFTQHSFVQIAPGNVPYTHQYQGQAAQNPMMVQNLGPQILPPAAYPLPNENQSSVPSNNNNGSDLKPKADSGRSQDSNFKRHVSQTSEDGPDPSQLKYDYRDELRRQIEDRRKLDEEKKNKEKVEEELLQEKVREDQERMRREYEEDEHRRRDKVSVRGRTNSKNIGHLKSSMTPWGQ